MGIIQRPRPFSWAFNNATLAMANLVCPNGWDLVPEALAPSTLEAAREYRKLTGKIAVMEGHSGDTVFGDKEVNEAFRAWHDWHHLTYNLPFTLEGERATAESQIAQLRRYGLATPQTVWLVREEVTGQARHYELWGAFPANQRMFARDWLMGVGLSFDEDGRPWPKPGEMWPVVPADMVSSTVGTEGIAA